MGLAWMSPDLAASTRVRKRPVTPSVSLPSALTQRTPRTPRTPGLCRMLLLLNAQQRWLRDPMRRQRRALCSSRRLLGGLGPMWQGGTLAQMRALDLPTPLFLPRL